MSRAGAGVAAGQGSTSSGRISAALERLNGTLARRPEIGRYTVSSVTTSIDGVRCSSEAGGWTIATDLKPVLGGDGSAPSPTMLLGAALGACLAMGYQLRAAEQGIDLAGVRVTVETDADTRGMLAGDAATPPGFTEVRYHVEVDSPASASDVERIVDLADRLSPVLDAITRANRVQRTISINEPVA